MNLEARQSILEAAFDLFHERGYNGVSMENVASAAGIKKANLFYYYPRKENLALAMLEHGSKPVIEEVTHLFSRHDMEPAEVVERFFADTVLRMSRTGCRRGCPFGNLAQEISDVNEVLRIRVSRGLYSLTSDLTRHFEQWRDKGYFRDGFDPAGTAQAVICLHQGAQLCAKAHKDVAVLESAGRMAVACLKDAKA
ncbi:MAG: TetR/AcrR family transcriptional regulator [Elusimicrobiota bacterium]